MVDDTARSASGHMHDVDTGGPGGGGWASPGRRDLRPITDVNAITADRAEETRLKAVVICAEGAAEAYAVRDFETVHTMYVSAVNIAGEHTAGLEFVSAFAKLAGYNRKQGSHDLVSRLTVGAYRYKPETIPRKTVRDLLIASGAAGYIPRRPNSHRRLSMVKAVK